MSRSDRSDVEQIEATVVGVSHFIDGRQWRELRELFADDIETDYTSLFGGEVQKQRADDLMEGWRALLTPVVTQHLLGPIHIEITGASAIASCHVRGYHRARNAPPGGDEWIVAGHYVIELEKADRSWKIRRMKLETFYQTGNTKLLEEVAGK